MGQSKTTTTTALFLLLSLCVSLATVYAVEFDNEQHQLVEVRRNLLQREGRGSSRNRTRREVSPSDDDEDEEKELTEEEREAAREEAALAAFEAAQERRANESVRIVARAMNRSADVVRRYLEDDTTEGRVFTFERLFRNGAGVIAKFALNTLMDSTGDLSRYVRRNFGRAITNSVNEGYAENTAIAVENALTIFETPGDHFNFLDALLARYNTMEKWNKGQGCEFIQDLFRDADAIAVEYGESMRFLASFSTEEYMPLTECFLDTCEGKAADCCTNSRALRRGLCGCPSARSTRCDFNLFSQRPRTVWICTTRACRDNEKCLCPEVQPS